MPYAQHAVSQEDLKFLEAQTDAKGRPIRIVKLPVPPPLHYTAEEAAGVQQVTAPIKHASSPGFKACSMRS
jgi:agmatine/peptidylarginine deiminase